MTTGWAVETAPATTSHNDGEPGQRGNRDHQKQSYYQHDSLLDCDRRDLLGPVCETGLMSSRVGSSSDSADTQSEVDARTLAGLMGSVKIEGMPLYRSLADQLRRIIADGTVPAGKRLPPERVMSAQLGVSRVTVTSAYRELREQGWAAAIRGAGTFVAVPSDGSSWVSMMGSEGSSVLDFVNAAPEASPFLADALVDAVSSLAKAMAGHGYAPPGTSDLRRAIADRYSRRGLPTTPDQVLVVSGAGDAMHLVLDTFVSPGNRVLIEHPTYPGAPELLESFGALPVPVAVDAGNPDALVDDVDRAARQNAPTLAYFMPDFSNPSGNRMTADGRRRLAATLARHGVLTIVDEVAADLTLDHSDPLEPFGVPVPGTATISIGSLSKTVWGGLRVGWVRSDQQLISRMARVYNRRQLSVSMVEQATAVRLFAVFDDIVAERVAGLRERRDLLVSRVATQLPDWTFRVPDGGLSLWCGLPQGLSSQDLVRRAATRDLLLVSGTRFGTGYAFDDRLRIPFTRSASEIVAAVDVLAKVVTGDVGLRADAPAVEHIV